MEQINWGIIGCGDVTEVKSGPAFNKVPNSRLVAVMRRDAEKAADYARRHQVPRWYSNVDELIADAEVNAIYIATPPSSHEAYTLAAIEAGKPVYVEKPMTLNYPSALRMVKAASQKNVKLTVAHYRRQQPVFLQVKKLLDDKEIGGVRLAAIQFYKQLPTSAEMKNPGAAWRVDMAISGGGLFHDLAPHQLDLMYYFFGEPEKVVGLSTNQAGLYAADDLVSGSILFKSGVVCQGTWCFAADKNEERDVCEIIGEKGSIRFSIFGKPEITVVVEGVKTMISYEPLKHVQQPMIEQVVLYFLNQGSNPCSGEDGAKVMQMLDRFTA